MLLLLIYRQIYVSTAGNSSGSGTKENPVSSPQDAVKLIKNADDDVDIIFEEGVHFVKQKVRIDQWYGNNSGTLRLLGQKNSALSAGFEIKGWEKDPEDEHVYKTQINTSVDNWRFHILWVNDKVAQRAKSPSNLEMPRIKKVQFFPHNESFDKYIVQIPEDAFEHLKGLSIDEIHDIQIVIFHQWLSTRAPLTEIFVDNFSISFFAKAKKDTPITRVCLFHLENYKKALNSPGEWFLDRKGVLFYYPRLNENINEVKVYSSYLDTMFLIQKNNVVIENLTLMHSGGFIPEKGIFQQESIWLAMITAYCSNFTIRNCAIKHAMFTSIIYMGEYLDITHNLVEDFGGGGIQVNGNYTFIENNIVRHGTRIVHCSNGIVITGGTHGAVRRNTICDNLYNGMAFFSLSGQKTNNCTIELNHIYHIGFNVMDDFGAIYLGASRQGLICRNNWVHDGAHHIYGGNGYYFDNYITGGLLESNIAYDFTAGSFHLNDGVGVEVRNNIFAFSNLEVGVIQKTVNYDRRMVTFTNNIVVAGIEKFYNNLFKNASFLADENILYSNHTSPNKFGGTTWEKWKDRGLDTTSFLEDPHFVDVANRNFSFRDTDTIDKIGFKPFNYRDCGVTGKEWREFAESYEPEPFPNNSFNFHNIIDFEEPDSLSQLQIGGNIQLSEKQKFSGKQSMMITGGNDVYALYYTRISDGILKIEFRAFLETGMSVSVDMRESNIQTTAISFSGGKASAGSKQFANISENKWFHVKIEAGINHKYTGTFSAEVDGQRIEGINLSKRYISTIVFNTFKSGSWFVDDLSVSSDIPVKKYFTSERAYGSSSSLPISNDTTTKDQESPNTGIIVGVTISVVVIVIVLIFGVYCFIKHRNANTDNSNGIQV